MAGVRQDGRDLVQREHRDTTKKTLWKNSARRCAARADNNEKPDHQNENNEPMMKSWVISRFALRAQTTRLKQKTSLKTREKRKTDTKQAETKGTKHRETNVKTDRRKKSL
jgi:hypothetical protein